MGIIKQLLDKDCQYELIDTLKLIYKQDIVLEDEDITLLKKLESDSYAFNGIVGLLIKNKARMFLGRKQNFDVDINTWCNDIPYTDEDLYQISIKFLDDDFREEPEVVLRKVMLEYPKKM